MKVRISEDPNKLVFFAFYLALGFILLYELLFMNYPAFSKWFYKLGVISASIAYSTIAASVFYYISVYIPRKKKSRTILFEVAQRVQIIDTIVHNLRFNLGIENNEIRQNEVFKEKLSRIDPNEPVFIFQNWYEYLAYVKRNLIDVIKSISLYNDYLSRELFHEVLLMEKQLYELYTFDGLRVLGSSNLSYAEIDIQNLLVHNKHLHEQKEIEIKKHERELKKDWKEYRHRHYGE